MGGVLVGSTMPGFWLGLMLILLFGAAWLVSGFGRAGLEQSGAAGADHRAWRHGAGARVTRVSMIEAGQRDFVMLLHAKGLSPLRIQLRHVLRHALIPVVTILACASAGSWAGR
jgi:glutathione transport system permease protein